MQICISKIILNKQVDLRESETLKHILKSARSPITSIEHFIWWFILFYVFYLVVDELFFKCHLPLIIHN